MTTNDEPNLPVKIEPNAQFLDGETPTIKWDGKDWPIPLLAPRENRFIIPAILRLGPVLNNLKQHQMSAEQYDDITTIIFWGLKRAHPLLRKDYFEGIAYSWKDTMAGVITIAIQTGVVEKAPAKPKDGEGSKMGEGAPPPAPVETKTE